MLVRYAARTRFRRTGGFLGRWFLGERTGGRVLKPFDESSADLFTRDGLAVTDSPQSIWDLLVPWLLALIILDVSVRRIAWDWPAIQRMALAVASRQVCGCCSLAPGGRFGIKPYSCADDARTFPSRASTTRTFVDCVPLSMPSKSDLITRPTTNKQSGDNFEYLQCHSEI